MPRSSFPAAAATQAKRRTGMVPTVLVDVQLRDGTIYYFGDTAGTYPMKIGAGGNVLYSPWVTSVGPFVISKSQQTDAGDVVLHNLSGNTIERDLAKALKAKEFEGALVVVRFWNELLATSEMEFHGTLGDQHDQGDSVPFRFQQLTDGNSLEIPVDPYATQCTLEYKGSRCGSTGAAAACPKDYASCLDASRAAIERFNGIPVAPAKLEYYKAEEPNPVYGRTSGYKLDVVYPDISVTYSDRSNPKLGGFIPILYGPVRGSGVPLLNHNRVPIVGISEVIGFLGIGMGECDGIDRLWISNRRVDPTDTSQFHFHAGSNGTLGGGLAATSVGPDQGVDSFFTFLPGVPGLTFSLLAYLAYKVTQGTHDIQAVPEVKIDMRGRKCRIFDAAGNQTAYQYTANLSWQILDLIITFMIRRDSLPGAALSAAEKTRIDFAAWAQLATDCDFDIGGGIKRFEGGLAIVQKTTLAQALSQMLGMCNSYLFEVDGKISVGMDKTRASTFTLTTDHLDGRVEEMKTSKRKAPNRLIGHFRDINVVKIADIEMLANNGAVRLANVVTIRTKTDHYARLGDYYVVQGVSVGTNSFNGTFVITVVPDSTHFKYAQVGANETQGGGTVGRDESRFMDDSRIIDHREHQLMAGQRGVGLSPTSNPITVEYDFGNNTAERVERLLKYIAVRNLGVGLETADLAGGAYKIPRECRVRAWFDSVDAANNVLRAQVPGDIITIDKSCSEEWTGDYEIQQIVIPQIAVGLTGEQLVVELQLLEYISSAFSDVAGPQPVKSAAYPLDSPLLDAIGPDGHYSIDVYHDSAGRVGSTNDRFGSTGSLGYITVASFTIHLPPRVTTYQGTLQANNPDAASFVAGPTNTTGWTNSNNANAQDATGAIVNIPPGGTSALLLAEGFGFAIPSYHTILGVTARVRRKASTAVDITDNTVKLLKAAVAAGTSKSAGGAWPSSYTDKTYGSGSDLWGTTLTPSDVNNAGFGLEISGDNNHLTLTRTADIDYIELTITTDRGAFSGKARLKIGAQTSNEVILTSPATTASALVSLTGLTANSDVLVEVQAIVTSAAGNVEGRFTQSEYKDQDYSHFKGSFL